MFEKFNETFLGKRLAHSKLFRRRIDSRRTRKDFAFQEIVNPAGEYPPIVDQRNNNEHCNDRDCNEHGRTQEQVSQAAPKAHLGLGVSNDARAGPGIFPWPHSGWGLSFGWVSYSHKRQTIDFSGPTS